MVVQPKMVFGLTGPQTMRHIDEVCGRLREALDSGENVELDCSEVTEVDFSFLQLFVAARKSACARGKSLALGPVLSVPMREALIISGLSAALDGQSRLAGGQG